MNYLQIVDNQITKDCLERIAQIERTLKDYEEIQKSYKQELLDFMEKTGVTEIDTDYFKVKYIGEVDAITLDQEKLKKEFQEVYLECQKLSSRKSSVRLTLKK